jgi:hypothetical protein
MNWNISSEQNTEANLRFLAARIALFSCCNFWVGAGFCIAVLFTASAVLTPASAKDTANVFAILTLIYSLFEVGYIERLLGKRASQCAGLAEEFDCRVFEIERNPNFAKEDTDSKIDTLSSQLSGKKREEIKNWYSDRLGEIPKPVAALIAQYTSAAYDQGLRHLYLKILRVVAILLSVAILTYIAYEDQKFRSSIVIFAVPFLPILVWLIKAIAANHSLVVSQETALKLMEDQWELVKRRRLLNKSLALAVRDNQDALYCRRSNPSLVFPKLYALYRPTLENRASKKAGQLVDEYLSGENVK